MLPGDRLRPRGGRKARLARPLLEPLEDRACPSVFYDFEVLARTGQNGIGSSILPAVSINDSGAVAFVASTGAGQDIFAGSDPASIRGISELVAANRTYGQELQINNSGHVGAVAITGGATVLRTARIYDSSAPGSFTNIGRGTSPRSAILQSSWFDSIGAFTSLSNDGRLAFAGFEADTPTPTTPSSWEIHLADGLVDSRDVLNTEDSEVVQLPSAPTFFRFSAADGEKVVVASRDGASGPKRIVLYDDISGSISSTTIAATGAVWTDLGIRPGISDDGSVVVFVGNRGNGLGVFASVAGPGGARTLVTIAGENGGSTQLAELGYDAAAQPIYFGGFELDSRVNVAVYHRAGGDPEAVDPAESFAVSFIGTPSQASRSNPITGQPLLFRAAQGIWTTLVRADAPIGGAGATAYHRASATPVVQVGDQVEGGTVTSLAVHDSLSTAARLPGGTARTVQPGDHYVAFQAVTSSGTVVVRAAQLDSDGDGLFDHWEGQGVDIDQDGSIDLDLAALGANPLRKDMFLEVDWLRDDAATGRVFAPQPAALSALVSTFAAAPVANPNGTTGITVHIDAGAGLSLNMAAAGGTPAPGALQGGDRIGQVGSGAHIDVLYFGQDGSVTFPGKETRSMESIKQAFFGTTSKWARVLAFRYVVFGDRHTSPTNGSSGRGEITWFDSSSMHTLPGNDFLVTLQGGRDPVSLAVPSGGPAGTPTTIPTPTGFMQAQTLIHELGHTLGLRHGGVDNTTSPPPGWSTHVAANYKPAYRSVMNYAYQFSPDTSGLVVDRYSGAGDPVFDDWSNIQLGFARYFDDLDNSFGRTSRLGSPPPDAEVPEPTVEEIEAIHGPLDRDPPAVAITLAPGMQVSVGGDLTVTLTASDNVALDSVFVAFDIDGDGSIDPLTERIRATATGGGNFQAVFRGIVGRPGLRAAMAVATDRVQFQSIDSIDVEVRDGVTNVPPVAGDDAADTRRGVPVVIDVLANDADADGTLDRASVQVVGGPAHGSVAIDPVTGVITYTPAAGYVGPDSFTYTVADDAGARSSAATVSLVVQLPLEAGPIVVNGGAAQRSNLETISVRFNQGTNLADRIADGSIVDAAEVVRVTGSPARVGLTPGRYRWDAATNTLVIDLTTDGFGGGGLTMLPDGNYEVRLHSARISAVGTGLALEDADGAADGVLASRFHRLAGDFDGNKAVDATDQAAWFDTSRVRYGSRVGQPGYSVVYDLDGDGVISSRDYYLWLRTMYGRSLL